MLKIRVYAAAGDTFQVSGLARGGIDLQPRDLAPVDAPDGRVRFEGWVSPSRQDYRIDYYGDLQPKAHPQSWDDGIGLYRGNVSQVREYYGGRLAFTTVLSPDAKAHTYINDWAKQFYAGVNFRGNAFDNEFHSENGTDVLEGLGGDDFLASGAGNDLFFGGAGNDRIFAGEGNDVLNGGTGRDRLDGSYGDDTFQGGPGQDRIFGGKGRDVQTGGTDADTFVFTHVNESRPAIAQRDVINDFRPGEDILALGRIDARSDHAGNDRFTFIGDAEFSGVSGQLRYDHGMMQADVNGDGRRDFVIEFVGAQDIGAADILL